MDSPRFAILIPPSPITPHTVRVQMTIQVDHNHHLWNATRNQSGASPSHHTFSSQLTDANSTRKCQKTGVQHKKSVWVTASHGRRSGPDWSGACEGPRSNHGPAHRSSFVMLAVCWASSV